MDPAREPAQAPGRRDPAKIARMYRKKARRLEKDLHAELGRNVDLYNRKNKADAVLRRLAQENKDLLDVLSQSLDKPSLPNAERTALTPEQEELFQLESL